MVITNIIIYNILDYKTMNGNKVVWEHGPKSRILSETCDFSCGNLVFEGVSWIQKRICRTKK
jgi:hypothetical protein